MDTCLASSLNQQVATIHLKAFVFCEKNSEVLVPSSRDLRDFKRVEGKLGRVQTLLFFFSNWVRETFPSKALAYPSIGASPSNPEAGRADSVFYSAPSDFEKGIHVPWVFVGLQTLLLSSLPATLESTLPFPVGDDPQTWALVPRLLCL